jgi:NTE family protein
MAIPVVFQPSSRDGVMLLDGGIKNNFPADVAKKMGADIIIAVDIRLDYFEKKEIPTLNYVVGRIASFSNLEIDSVKRSYCNLIIRPDLKGYTMSSFNRSAADTLIQRGRQAAERSREQLRTLKAAYDLKYHQISRQYVHPDKWHITALQFSGDSYLSERYMEHVLNLDIPGDYTMDEIKSAIDRLYGLGGFESIYYDLPASSDGKVLKLNIMTSKKTSLNLGFHTNTIDNSAILLNLTSRNFNNIFGLFSAGLELSANPELSFTTELNQRNLPALGIIVSGKRQKYNTYNYNSKLSETDLFYAKAGFYTYQPFLKNFNLGLGITEEYYRTNNLNLTQDFRYTDGKNDFTITNIYSFLSFDNMDEYYFPGRGSEFYSELSFLTDFKKNSEVYLNFLLRNRNVIPVTSKVTFLLDLYSRIEFNPGVPQPKNTLVGGETYTQYFNYHFPFMGLPVVNIAGRYTYLGLTGLRFELPRSQYLSLIFNGLLHGSELIPWKNTFIPGCGVRYSLKSLLGPLNASIGYSFRSSKPVFSAGFGFWF